MSFTTTPQEEGQNRGLLQSEEGGSVSAKSGQSFGMGDVTIVFVYL